MENREYERLVLAGLKFNSEYYERLSLVPDDFCNAENREVYRAIEALIQAGRKPDDMAIMDWLSTHDGKTSVSSYVSLEPLPVENIAFYAEHLKDLSKRRGLARLSLIIADEVKSKKPTGEVIEVVEQFLTTLSDSSKTDIRELKNILEPTLGEIERRYNLRGGLTGICTGFPPLDQVTNGLQRGELIIVGARPSIGKTAFAITMAVYQALKGITVGFFSCEMSGVQMMFRVLSGQSKVNITNLSSGYMQEQHFKRMVDAADNLHEAKMYIDDSANPSLTQIYSRARKMARLGVQIIYVDYLTLINWGNATMHRAERVGYISKALKQLARELNLPVVVMSQVNRDAEGKEPTLAELRQSGEIEEDADVVIFLHRDRVDHECPAEVIVAKNRNGATTKFSLMFLPQYVRFEQKA